MRTRNLATIFAASGALLLGSIMGCSGSMVSSDGKSGSKETATIDADADSELTFSSGNLGGTQIAIPAGALESGSTVSASEVSAPAAFSSNANVSSASSALSVSATDANGNTLDSLTQPMTIQIPLGGSGLALAVEETEDNLCALLAGADNTNYVWRRGSMNIVENKAVFDSTKLGTFQLVYCGTETLDGFSDAKDENIAGAASTLLATLSTVGLGDTSHKFCTAFVRRAVIFNEDEGDGETSPSDFLSPLTEHSPEAASVNLEVYGSPGARISSLSDTEEYQLVIFIQTAQDHCGMDEGRPEGIMLSGMYPGDKVKAGKITVDNVLDAWSIGTVNMSLGSSTTGPNPFPMEACAYSKGDTSGTMIQQPVTFGVSQDGAGTVNGHESGDIYYASSDESATETEWPQLHLEMNRDCHDDHQASTETPTSEVRIEVDTAGTAILMYPTTLSTPASAGAQGKCVIVSNQQHSTDPTTNEMAGRVLSFVFGSDSTTAQTVDTYLPDDLSASTVQNFSAWGSDPDGSECADGSTAISRYSITHGTNSGTAEINPIF